MEVRYRIYKSRDLIVTDAHGQLDLSASREAICKLASHPDYDEDYEIIMDLRDAQCDLSVHDIYQLATFMAAPDPALPTRRKIAVLVSDQEAFDYAEFLALCAQNRGMQVQPFTTPAAAERWLNST